MTKANNGSGNNEERDEWQTPKELFNELNRQYEFDFDCCANKQNKKCNFWHDSFETVNVNEAGLLEEETAWMNPPFSKARAMFEHFFKVVNQGIAIYRFDNPESKLWQEVIFPNASWIFVPKGRVNYEGMKGKRSRFPSALIGYNIEPPKEIDGTCLHCGKDYSEHKKDTLECPIMESDRR